LLAFKIHQRLLHVFIKHSNTSHQLGSGTLFEERLKTFPIFFASFSEFNKKKKKWEDPAGG